MHWNLQEYRVVRQIQDKYYFAGHGWDTQVARRFILNVERINKPVESSIYLHLDTHGKPVNVAFEPSISFGCQPRCGFCASGNLFPISALSEHEVHHQVAGLITAFNEEFPEYSGIRKDVFYAGIGEPTLLSQTLIRASKTLKQDYPDLGFKLSTMGARPDTLTRFTADAIGLRSLQAGIPHHEDNKLRKLYVNLKRYRLEHFLDEINAFRNVSGATRVKINYVVMKDFNDGIDVFAKTLHLVLDYLGPNFELKISCLNPTVFAGQNGLHSVGLKQLQALEKYARSINLADTYLFGPMSEQKLGCGQLAGDYVNATPPVPELST